MFPMGKKTYLSVALLLAIPHGFLFPLSAQALENCSNTLADEYNFRCLAKTSALKSTPQKLILKLDERFKELPSCEFIDARLKKFVQSIKRMRKQQYGSLANTPSSFMNQSLRQEIKPSMKPTSISSKDIFLKRFSVSPVAKQYYFSFLQAVEAANASFNRPVISLDFNLNSKTEYSKSVSGSLRGPLLDESKSYTHETDPTLSIDYTILSFQNLFATKAQWQSQKAAYYTFIDQAVVDSLDTVSNFYDFKANVLSTIINSVQYQASSDRVRRLNKLEAKGLNSVLDVSRANVTEISQASSLLSARSLLAQSYEKLIGDFMFHQSLDSDIDLSYSNISSACWKQPPSISVKRAIDSNPSIAALRHSIESSRLTERSILSGNLPEVSIGLSYETDNQWGDINGTGYVNDYSQTQDVVASATVNWNIFDFGQTFAQAKSQKNATSSLANELSQNVNQLETDLLTYFTQYVTNTINVVDLSNGSSKATVNYLNSLKASQAGFLNQTDVDNVFDQLTSLNQNLIESIKGRNTAAVNIAKLVQSKGFDSIDFDQFLQDWKNTFPK